MTKNELLKKINYGKERGAQAKLASALQISTASVANWFSGKNYPTEQNIKKIADIFNLETADVRSAFYASEDFVQSVQAVPLTPTNTINLPILADVPAGLPEYSERDVEMFIDIPRWLFPGADFVVKCIGDSLEPEIKKGDYCVIRKMTDPLDCKPMLVKTDSGICMKVIRKGKDGKTWLCSLNPKYKPFVSSSLTIIGLILGRWNRTDRDSFRVELPEDK